MKPEFQLFADAGLPHPCCVPSRQRAAKLEESRRDSASRERVASGSAEGMVRLDGGVFLMGTDTEEGFPADGEGPVREVTLDPFLIDAGPVTNHQFREFVNATGYATEAERFGWSFVFRGHIPPELIDRHVPDLNWWCKVNGAACVTRPESLATKGAASACPGSSTMPGLVHIWPAPRVNELNRP